MLPIMGLTKRQPESVIREATAVAFMEPEEKMCLHIQTALVRHFHLGLLNLFSI